jgi:hypothetical protein
VRAPHAGVRRRVRFSIHEEEISDTCAQVVKN